MNLQNKVSHKFYINNLKIKVQNIAQELSTIFWVLVVFVLILCSYVQNESKIATSELPVYEQVGIVQELKI